MSTLREAVLEYLSMRRNLGFKLRDAGKALLDFANFMEQSQAPFITEALALAWAQQPESARPAYWSKRLGHVRVFARYRKATDPRTEVPSPGLLPFRPSGQNRICTPMKRSRTCCAPPSTCRTVLNVAHCCPGSTIACSVCSASRGSVWVKRGISNSGMSISIPRC